MCEDRDLPRAGGGGGGGDGRGRNGCKCKSTSGSALPGDKLLDVEPNANKLQATRPPPPPGAELEAAFPGECGRGFFIFHLLYLLFASTKTL